MKQSVMSLIDRFVRRQQQPPCGLVTKFLIEPKINVWSYTKPNNYGLLRGFNYEAYCTLDEPSIFKVDVGDYTFRINGRNLWVVEMLSTGFEDEQFYA